jgi:hypothetical protein
MGPSRIYKTVWSASKLEPKPLFTWFLNLPLNRPQRNTAQMFQTKDVDVLMTCGNIQNSQPVPTLGPWKSEERHSLYRQEILCGDGALKSVYFLFGQESWKNKKVTTWRPRETFLVWWVIVIRGGRTSAHAVSRKSIISVYNVCLKLKNGHGWRAYLESREQDSFAKQIDQNCNGFNCWGVDYKNAIC